MSEVTVEPDTVSHGSDRSIPPRWRSVALAASSLAVGIAVGVAVARSSADDAYAGDGGVVYVCNGKALALVHASGLGDREVEVQFPVRGDGVLLPITVEGVEVLAGRAVGHQYYRPVGGQVALARDVGVPEGQRHGPGRRPASLGTCRTLRHPVARRLAEATCRYP